MGTATSPAQNPGVQVNSLSITKCHKPEELGRPQATVGDSKYYTKYKKCDPFSWRYVRAFGVVWGSARCECWKRLWQRRKRKGRSAMVSPTRWWCTIHGGPVVPFECTHRFDLAHSCVSAEISRNHGWGVGDPFAPLGRNSKHPLRIQILVLLGARFLAVVLLDYSEGCPCSRFERKLTLFFTLGV